MEKLKSHWQIVQEAQEYYSKQREKSNLVELQVVCEDCGIDFIEIN